VWELGEILREGLENKQNDAPEKREDNNQIHMRLDQDREKAHREKSSTKTHRDDA
jgi:hypothetical protein